MPEPWRTFWYQDRDGRLPAREFYENLPAAEREHADFLMQLLRQGGPHNLTTDEARRARGKIWELRPGGNRFLYFTYTGRKVIFVHGFRKKSEKTPERQIRIAERRYQDYVSRQSE